MWREPTLQKTLDKITSSVFGDTIQGAQDKAVCLTCGEAITGFRDEISQSEYDISGMCQKCQDSVFDEED